MPPYVLIQYVLIQYVLIQYVLIQCSKIDIWNTLSKKVNDIYTLEPFKVAVGEFLAQYPDWLPVVGYTHPNSSSLLDWSAAGEIGVCE